MAYVFYSQMTEIRQYGKNEVRLPVLKRFFTNVREGEAGWFGAPVKLTEEQKQKLEHRIRIVAPDLVVDAAAQ